RAERLIHHSDRGVQYLSIRYTERLAEAGIEPSVGSKGDSYDNALAETIIGLFKTEVIRRRGPGEASKTWSLPRSTGSGGSITTASSSRLGMLPRSSMRRPTGAGRQLSRNRCHSSKQVSEKIGAV